MGRWRTVWVSSRVASALSIISQRATNKFKQLTTSVSSVDPCLLFSVIWLVRRSSTYLAYMCGKLVAVGAVGYLMHVNPCLKYTLNHPFDPIPRV
ncbi:hypothetical protein DFH11DRAFT_1581455 [Phellopilus nigrolimitatus]|nr:hypothetical protein DFH11DRAFT_1581455 [Phellopilus nigrolimitatus]